MSIPVPPPPPVPDPKLDATTLSTQLPQAQVENLRYKIIQIMESINGLLVTLNTGGMQLAAGPNDQIQRSPLENPHSSRKSLDSAYTKRGYWV
ncbi:hypothetical protein AG1IA_07099 [Rhizoctonia solani AG-1 IA]|uniref:Uncharacterized protein n=1 Tax=Thanatephorus cucumeris (strain AG1-IA) TaxID=983506 RepID=L8WL27_THACA|nr:hypothetical protein AG1IA_07099 [Rhizoctonia solani AG-1 IA]